MTTLTTVMGMVPLAVGFGEGSEMLQPLAVVIVWGLSFSMLVTLLQVPSVYRMLPNLLPQQTGVDAAFLTSRFLAINPAVVLTI
jgi:Cu/Ag efflux pump CusA